VPVSRLRPDTPPALADLIRRLLSKDAAARPASAAAVAEELARIKPVRRRSWAGWAVGVAALFVALALCGLVVIRITDKDGKQTTVKVPPGSEVAIDKGGEVKVKLPGGGKKPAPARLTPAGRLGEQVGRWHVCSLDFSRDGARLLSAGGDGYVRLWGLAGRREVLWFEGLRGEGMHAALSPDGTKALSGGWHQPMRLWDLVKNRQIAAWVPQGSENIVLTTPVFTADGKQAFLAHRDAHAGPTTVRLWELAGPREVRAYRHPSYVFSVAVLPGGKRFLTLCHDRNLRLWSVEGGKEVARVTAMPGRNLTSLALSPDGKVALSIEYPDPRLPGYQEGKTVPAVRVLNVSSDALTPRADYTDLPAPVARVAWSGDGKRFAYVTGQGHVVARAFPSGKVLAEARVAAGALAIALSPDGRRLAVGDGPSVALFDLPAEDRRE
jgi:hypothetical protein